MNRNPEIKQGSVFCFNFHHHLILHNDNFHYCCYGYVLHFITTSLVLEFRVLDQQHAGQWLPEFVFIFGIRPRIHSYGIATATLSPANVTPRDVKLHVHMTCQLSLEEFLGSQIRGVTSKRVSRQLAHEILGWGFCIRIDNQLRGLRRRAVSDSTDS